MFNRLPRRNVCRLHLDGNAGRVPQHHPAVLREIANLCTSPWRGLRDSDFEKFLCRVFVLNGYLVTETGKSGDFGVDLILVKGFKRIAVQAKGYKGKVDPSAIQEVVAGASYHCCDAQVVVTNSTFTRNARALAKANRCLLVDGLTMSSLIQGKVQLAAFSRLAG